MHGTMSLKFQEIFRYCTSLLSSTLHKSLSSLNLSGKFSACDSNIRHANNKIVLELKC